MQDATAEEECEFDEEEGEYDGWALQTREEQVLKHLPFGGWLGPGHLRLFCSSLNTSLDVFLIFKYTNILKTRL